MNKLQKIAKRVVKFLAATLAVLFLITRLLHINSLHLNHTLAYVVHNTNGVDFDKYIVYKSPDDPSGVKGTLTVAGTGFHESSPGEYGKMFYLLRSTNQFHQKPLGNTDNIRVLFTLGEDNDDYPHMYEYLPNTGEIGKGDEWCTVPPELRVWIAQQLKISEKKSGKNQSGP